MLWDSPRSRTIGPRYGLLGGTFDPPHNAHLFVAQEALARLGLARVYFVPAGTPPHKLGRPITAAAHRLAMLQRAIAGNAGFAVSTVELERPGPSYTVETLARLRAEWGRETELALIVGWDMLLDLPHWREPRRIVDTVDRIVAVHRPGYDNEGNDGDDGHEGNAQEDALARALPSLRPKLIKLPVPQLGISATELRQRVAASLPIRYLVPDGVAEYIAEHRLYRADRDDVVADVVAADAQTSREAGAGQPMIPPVVPPAAGVAHNVHVPDEEVRP